MTRKQAVAVATRVLGREAALRLCADLPASLDSDDDRDLATMRALGLTREQLFEDMEAEL